MPCVPSASLSVFALLFWHAGGAAAAGRDADQPDCPALLALLSVKTERPAPFPAPPDAACIIAEPVLLISVTPEKGEAIVFPDRPLLSCAMVERLARFSAEIAAPLAVSAFGKPLVSVSTGPGYECRPRNRVAGAKISSHGQGDAADIARLELAGGRTIIVENPKDAVEVKFLADFRTAGCAVFNTVLGPGADAAHANHIHIDIVPRGKSGQSKFCQ